MKYIILITIFTISLFADSYCSQKHIESLFQETNAIHKEFHYYKNIQPKNINKELQTDYIAFENRIIRLKKDWYNHYKNCNSNGYSYENYLNLHHLIKDEIYKLGAKFKKIPKANL